jgi:predicted MFS family arabinose efflux permease
MKALRQPDRGPVAGSNEIGTNTARRHDAADDPGAVDAAPGNAVGEARANRTGGVLGRYVAAASAARTADEGMAPALALLVAAAGRDPAFAGVLLAAAGLPHVVAGPLTGALLDTVRHRRTALALAPVVFALVLAGTALGLGRVPDALCIALVAAAGCAGPLLTGGLTAELTRLVPSRQGRALALDGASYNVAAIAGPAAVAGCAVLGGAEAAALCLAALALGATAVVLRLPATTRGNEARGWRDGLGGARRLWNARPLRLVTAGTTLAFVGAGALPLVVIARAAELGSATAGAALLAAMAAGALAGALVVAAADEPRSGGARLVTGGSPERRVVRFLLAVAVALVGAAAASGLGTLGAGLVVAGVADGMLFPAMLAVRTRHSRTEERGAVFTTAASLKIAAGALGAGAGGALMTATGAATALLVAAGLHVAGALLCYRAAS